MSKSANQPGRPVGTHDSDSRVSRIARLFKNECDAITSRMLLTKATPEALTAEAQRLASTARKAIQRANERGITEATYEINTGHYTTSGSRYVVVVANITRTK